MSHHKKQPVVGCLGEELCSRLGLTLPASSLAKNSCFKETLFTCMVPRVGWEAAVRWGAWPRWDRQENVLGDDSFPERPCLDKRQRNRHSCCSWQPHRGNRAGKVI